MPESGLIGRRGFLSRSLGAAAALLAAPVTAAARPAGAGGSPPRPCPPAAWHRHGVILEPTEPWEGDHIQCFTSPAEVRADGRWRIWYSVVTAPRDYAIAYAEGVPGEPMAKTRVVCSPGRPAAAPFALGGLPDAWRPAQVVHVRLPSGRHRIYFWAHGPDVLRYLAAEGDDGCRYTVTDPHRPVLYHYHDRAAWGVASPDGVCLHPQPSPDRPADEPPAPAHLITNDATTVYQLPDGSFELYTAALVSVPADDPAYVAEDNAPGLRRVIDRCVSADGLRFEQRRRVVQPDERDPADQQFYYLAVTPTARGRVGLLGHYRCRAQTMDLEWCWSADGRTWQRPERRPWLARGAPGRPDCYGIYASSGLVESGGRHHLIYTGVNSAHNGRHSHGPPRTVIMHASTPSIWA